MERKILVLLVGLILTGGMEKGKAQEDSLNIRFLGKCNIPNAKDIYVSGDYAYIVSGDSGLYIINVRDPQNPKKVENYKLKEKVYSVWVKGNYAYIGGINGLHILDISDFKNPKKVGIYENVIVTEVRINGDYAYCCGKDSTWNLYIFDISNPSSPAQVGFYEIGKSFHLDIFSVYCYIGKERDSLFEVIDVTDPKNPQKVSSYSLKNTLVSYGVKDIQVENKYAYLSMNIDRQWGSGALCIIDVSNPLNPYEVGRICQGWSTDRALGLWVEHPLIYVARGGHCLDVFDVSDPIYPKWVGFYLGVDCIIDVYGQNKCIYAIGSQGLWIFEFYGMGIEEKRGFEEKRGLFLEPRLERGSLLIKYALPASNFCTIKLYDSQGKLLKILYSGIKDAGTHTLRFSTLNLASGLYFLSLTTKERLETKKVVILR